ncbi:hypothetical protein [Pseudarthrobacter sp. NIBRBAC000502770]|uniref:hypothetical protein n=1 Tax=Pseudarthrobacter sp. NIBRBAC000502770 TaxID=2590785 RepID=UPI00113FD737|nr:hypothetical protein [Pseudarthrobacter sp. NIBRBAC000502770]QDG89099.1 hypothetical protein NIBR502770_11885 [Pseudarthrobacter sp. NIBRBAC000502770]
MGLRDDAEKLIKEGRAAAAEAARIYRDEVLAGVPNAITRWCSEALDMSAFESYTVLNDYWKSEETYQWYVVEVEFQLEDITFYGYVQAYDRSTIGRLDQVRVRKPGGFPGPFVTNKETLAKALEFHEKW